MVWPHWHHEKCTNVGCGTLRWILNAIRKWFQGKQNEKMLGWANNQAPIARHAHERKQAHTTFGGMFTRSKVIPTCIIGP
jgi:hypothetical protein